MEYSEDRERRERSNGIDESGSERIEYSKDGENREDRENEEREFGGIKFARAVAFSRSNGVTRGVVVL